MYIYVLFNIISMDIVFFQLFRIYRIVFLCEVENYIRNYIVNDLLDIFKNSVGVCVQFMKRLRLKIVYIFLSIYYLSF